MSKEVNYLKKGLRVISKVPRSAGNDPKFAGGMILTGKLHFTMARLKPTVLWRAAIDRKCRLSNSV